MGFAHRAFVAAGVGLAVSGIAGCGSSGGTLLSQGQANRLSEQLNSLTAAMDSNDCNGAQRSIARFQDELNGLSGVNSTLVANLQQGVSTIQSLATSQCRPQTATKPKKTRPKRTNTTTNTATATTSTYTAPTTPTYSAPTYTSPTVTTSPNGGVSPTGGTTSTTTTSSDTTTMPTTGGQGLGAGSDTTTTGGYTATTGVGF